MCKRMHLLIPQTSTFVFFWKKTAKIFAHVGQLFIRFRCLNEKVQCEKESRRQTRKTNDHPPKSKTAPFDARTENYDASEEARNQTT